MSKATKRKHVVKEVLNDYVLPEGDQEIVRVTASRGNNLHEVETAQSNRYLVSMPTRFRKNVWIKRGDFVLVEPIAEGDKVRAEILSILYKDQIKHIKDEGLWPPAFEERTTQGKNDMIPDDMLPPSDDSDEDLADMVVNTNRPQVVYVDTDSSDEDKTVEDDGNS
ncbi:probable RNA-binding protein EIF1AD [Haliotis rufescens]|uniref:probable RNA-binding protein EIF1AD n=1 Tax=Haliotis rufescens TaxID=6454 RepID=UPI001EAFCD09|nr:probable RNA-binding protein EIF1AD [Haliotis rufescens]